MNPTSRTINGTRILLGVGLLISGVLVGCSSTSTRSDSGALSEIDPAIAYAQDRKSVV